MRPQRVHIIAALGARAIRGRQMKRPSLISREGLRKASCRVRECQLSCFSRNQNTRLRTGLTGMGGRVPPTIDVQSAPEHDDGGPPQPMQNGTVVVEPLAPTISTLPVTGEGGIPPLSKITVFAAPVMKLI